MASSRYEHRIDLVGRDRVSGAFGSARSAAKKFGTATRDTLLTINQGIGVLQAFGSAVQNWVVAPISKSIEAFASFEMAMAEVWTIVDTNREGFEKLGREVDQFARKYGADAIDTAKAMYQTFSAGNTEAADATKVLEASIRFAKVALVDTSTAVDLITTIMNAYGFSADEAVEVSDKLFSTIKQGKTTGEELAKSYGRVAAMAANAGISFDDLSAAVAKLTLGGVKTAEAMTAVNGIIAAIIKPSGTAKDAIANLNLQFFNEDVLRDRGGIFKILDELSALSQESIGTLSTVIPNLEGLKAALGIQTGKQSVSDLLRGVAESSGLVEEGLEKMMSTLQWKLDIVNSEYDSMARKVGEVIGGNEDFVEAINTVSEGVAIFADTLVASKNDLRRLDTGLTDAAKAGLPIFVEMLAYMVDTLSGGTGLSFALNFVTNAFKIFANQVSISADRIVWFSYQIAKAKAWLAEDDALMAAWDQIIDDLNTKISKAVRETERLMKTGWEPEVNIDLKKVSANMRQAAHNMRAAFRNEAKDILVLPEGDNLENLNEALGKPHEEAAEKVTYIWAKFWADEIDKMGPIGAEMGGALSAEISGALVDQSKDWEDAFVGFGDRAKQIFLDQILEPILGAGGAINDLFTAVLTPMRAIGGAINDYIFRPLVDNILSFFGIKKALEKAAQAESAATQAAGVANTIAQNQAVVSAAMPGLTAAATASAIASFGSTLSFGPMAVGAITAAVAQGAGVAATANATGAANAAIPGMADGGRVTSRGIFEVGERGSELIIPETRPVRARSLLSDLARRNPALMGSAQPESGHTFNISVNSVGADATDLAEQIAQQVSEIIGANTYL